MKLGRASSQMYFNFAASTYIDVETNGTIEFRFENDGDFLMRRTWHHGQTFSDIKLKENIQNFENGLDIISKLKPVTFDWKDKERGGNSIGFIAQDVKEVIPNAVFEKKKLENNETVPYLAIENNQIIAALTKAVQEQQKQINELKQVINGISK